jgi:hypothetical protein
MGKGAFIEEVEVAKDVDRAVEGLDALVAPRHWYGKGTAVFNGKEVKVNQAKPGFTYVLDPNGDLYDLSYTDLAGKEWVRWPTESQLKTGRK